MNGDKKVFYVAFEVINENSSYIRGKVYEGR
jgi:hypothetical protein